MCQPRGTLQLGVPHPHMCCAVKGPESVTCPPHPWLIQQQCPLESVGSEMSAALRLVKV